MVLRSFTCWKVRAMPARAIWRCARRLMSCPRKLILPWFSGSAPVIRLNIVVLPAPLGPIRPKISPALTSKLTLSTATRPPKRRVAPATLRIGWPRSGCWRCVERAGGEGRGGLHARQPAQREGHDAGARPLQQQDEQHREHDDFELARGARRDHRQPVLDAVLEQGDDGRAHDRTREVGHAADHRHQQVEDADTDVEGRGADEAAHVGVEPARQRRQEGRDHEGDEFYAERIDAQALRHDLAAAQRAHRAALARIEQVGRQHQRHDHEDPDQVVDAVAARERMAADRDRRDLADAVVLPEHGHVAEQEVGRQPPGDGAERQEVAAQPQGHRAEDGGDQAGEHDAHDQPDPRRIARLHGEPGGGVGGDADERGLAEGQHAADARQQHQAEHGQRIDADEVQQRDAERAEQRRRERQQQDPDGRDEVELQARHSSASSSSVPAKLSERHSRTGMSRLKTSTSL